MRQLSFILPTCLFFLNVSAFATTVDENTFLLSEQSNHHTLSNQTERLPRSAFFEYLEKSRLKPEFLSLGGGIGMTGCGGLTVLSWMACCTVGSTFSPLTQYLWAAGNLASCSMSMGSAVVWKKGEEMGNSYGHYKLVRDAYTSLAPHGTPTDVVQKAKNRLVSRMNLVDGVNNQNFIDSSHFAQWLVLSDHLGKFLPLHSLVLIKTKELKIEIKEADLENLELNKSSYPIFQGVGEFVDLEPLELIRRALTELSQDFISNDSTVRIQALKAELDEFEREVPKILENYFREIQTRKE